MCGPDGEHYGSERLDFYRDTRAGLQNALLQAALLHRDLRACTTPSELLYRQLPGGFPTAVRTTRQHYDNHGNGGTVHGYPEINSADTYPASGHRGPMALELAAGVMGLLLCCWGSDENSIKPTRTLGTDLSGLKIHHILHVHVKQYAEYARICQKICRNMQVTCKNMQENM